MPTTTILDLTRQQVVTLLTLAIVGLWTLTAIVRLWMPFPAGSVLDAAMPLVVGFWFVSKTNEVGS